MNGTEIITNSQTPNWTKILIPANAWLPFIRSNKERWLNNDTVFSDRWWVSQKWGKITLYLLSHYWLIRILQSHSICFYGKYWRHCFQLHDLKEHRWRVDWYWIDLVPRQYSRLVGVGEVAEGDPDSFMTWSPVAGWGEVFWTLASPPGEELVGVWGRVTVSQMRSCWGCHE